MTASHCRSHLHRTTVAVAVVIAAIAATIPASADDSLERARRDGVTYAFSNEPPGAYMGRDGKPAGTSSEMVLAILERIGVTKVKPVQTEWAGLIPGLIARRFDLLQPMYILPTRCQQAAFSEPLVRTGAALLVRKGNPKRLHSYESLAKHPNATITVMAGAAEHGFARRAGVPEHRILPLQDPGAMLSAVKTSRADAASLTPSSITEMAKKGGDDVEMAKPFESPPWAMKYIAAPFHKDAVALREAFNRGLKEYVTSAHYQDVLARRPGAEHPGDMIAARQCTEE